MHSQQSAQQTLVEVDEVEVVAPQHDLAVADVEAATNPDPDVELAERQEVGALGEDRWTVGTDRVDQNIEAGPILVSPTEQAPNALATVDGWQTHVFVAHVHRQEGQGLLQVAAAQTLHKAL